jgi:hypothetical protein
VDPRTLTLLALPWLVRRFSPNSLSLSAEQANPINPLQPQPLLPSLHFQLLKHLPTPRVQTSQTPPPMISPLLPLPLPLNLLPSPTAPPTSQLIASVSSPSSTWPLLSPLTPSFEMSVSPYPPLPKTPPSTTTRRGCGRSRSVVSATSKTGRTATRGAER